MARRRSGFTLIELLVVIAIIAILAAVIFPVFMAAKRRANATKCMNNMAQIGKAISMYADDHRGYIPFIYPPNWSTWWTDTWRERLTDYTKNRAMLICPIRTKIPSYPDKDSYIGHYGINVYITMNDAMTEYKGTRQLSSVPLPAKTILVSENKDGDWSAEPLNNSGTGDAGQFYPYHGDDQTKGGFFLFCDGHTSFLSVYKTQEHNFFLWWVMKKY